MRLQSLCDEFEQQHEAHYGVPCTFTVLYLNGEYKIRCEVCQTRISPGLPKQRLQSLRKHYLESATHKANIISSSGRENVDSGAVAHFEITEAEKLAKLQKIAPGVFEIKEGYLLCKFCVGKNQKVILNPVHGSFEKNVRLHLESKGHQNLSRDGKKQMSLSKSFEASSTNPEKPKQ